MLVLNSKRQSTMKGDKPTDVFQCEVEVMFFCWFPHWRVKLRVQPRERHAIGPPFLNKPGAVRFANSLARHLNLPVRVLEDK